MKVFRSIAAVVVGAIAAVVVIMVVEGVNAFIYPPPGGMSPTEFMEAMQKGDPVAKEWIRDIPTSVMAMLQVGWGLGAFLGGVVAALIAGRGRLLHAGIIGAFVLAGTVANFFELKSKLDYVHPDWLLVTGLLLPLPLSLLGGKLVAVVFAQAPEQVKPT